MNIELNIPIINFDNKKLILDQTYSSKISIEGDVYQLNNVKEVLLTDQTIAKVRTKLPANYITAIYNPDSGLNIGLCIFIKPLIHLTFTSIAMPDDPGLLQISWNVTNQTDVGSQKTIYLSSINFFSNLINTAIKKTNRDSGLIKNISIPANTDIILFGVRQ